MKNRVTLRLEMRSRTRCPRVAVIRLDVGCEGFGPRSVSVLSFLYLAWSLLRPYAAKVASALAEAAEHPDLLDGPNSRFQAW